MLSFFEMFHLMEAADSDAVKLARNIMVGPVGKAWSEEEYGNPSEKLIKKCEEWLASGKTKLALEKKIDKEIKEALRGKELSPHKLMELRIHVGEGGDAREFAGPRSRELPSGAKQGDFGTGRDSHKNYFDKNTDISPDEVNKNTEQELGNLLAKKVPGSATAMAIFKVINSNPNIFFGKEFSTTELFLTLRKFKYFEDFGAKDIHLYEKALRILANLDEENNPANIISVTFLQIDDNNKISLAQDDPSKGVKKQLSKVGLQTAQQLLNKDEDRLSGKHHASSRDMLRQSDAGEEEMSPQAKNLIAETENEIIKANEIINQAKKLGFATIKRDDFDDLVEKIKQNCLQIKRLSISKEKKLAMWGEYELVDVAANSIEIEQAFKNPDIYTQAVDAVTKAMKAANQPTDNQEAIMQHAEQAVETLLAHPKIAQEPITLKNAQIMKGRLLEIQANEKVRIAQLHYKQGSLEQEHSLLAAEKALEALIAYKHISTDVRARAQEQKNQLVMGKKVPTHNKRDVPTKTPAKKDDFDELYNLLGIPRPMLTFIKDDETTLSANPQKREEQLRDVESALQLLFDPQTKSMGNDWSPTFTHPRLVTNEVKKRLAKHNGNIRAALQETQKEWVKTKEEAQKLFNKPIGRKVTTTDDYEENYKEGFFKKAALAGTLGLGGVLGGSSQGAEFKPRHHISFRAANK